MDHSHANNQNNVMMMPKMPSTKNSIFTVSQLESAKSAMSRTNMMKTLIW